LVFVTTIFLSRKKVANLIPKAVTQLKSGANKSFYLISSLPKKFVIPPLVVIATMISFVAVTMPDDKLHVSFLDVGQGDAILIQQGNQQVLVDGGPSPQTISLRLGEKMQFWDRTIDLMILTHPHPDHLVGLEEALRNFRVKQVLYPDLDYESPLYDEWLRLIEENNINSTIARTGQRIDFGTGIVINVVNPQVTSLPGAEPDIDNNGVVLRIVKDNISFLLTADIGQEAEFKLITYRPELSSTVLKVAHHGSDTSTTTDFLATVDPQLAVISAGINNQFGHPSTVVLERLKESLEPRNIYRTDRQGTIEFTTDGERLWVNSGR
jgi:competence protein ComEC